MMTKSVCRIREPHTCRTHSQPSLVTVDAVFNLPSDKPAVFSTTQEFVSFYKKLYPKLSLIVTHDPITGFVILNQIIIPKEDRRLGLGSRIIQDFVNMADEYNFQLALTPDSVFGTPQAKLEVFYRKFGFVRNLGRNQDFSISETMVRYPQ